MLGKGIKFFPWISCKTFIKKCGPTKDEFDQFLNIDGDPGLSWAIVVKMISLPTKYALVMHFFVVSADGAFVLHHLENLKLLGEFFQGGDEVVAFQY